jgi:hypothetical protein
LPIAPRRHRKYFPKIIKWHLTIGTAAFKIRASVAEHAADKQ